MCWEDVKINRQQYVGNTQRVVADNATLAVFPPNTYRQRVIISPIWDASIVSTAPQITITKGQTLAGQIVFLGTVTLPYVFDIADWGDILQTGFNIVGNDSGANNLVTYTEILLNDPKEYGVALQ